jgi:hypothetical protein
MAAQAVAPARQAADRSVPAAFLAIMPSRTGRPGGGGVGAGGPALAALEPPEPHSVVTPGCA